MKRNIFKALGTLVVAAVAGTLFSCGNISDSFDAKNVGYIRIGETSSRTVNPALDGALESMTEISLKGNLPGKDEETFLTGKAYADLSSATIAAGVGSWSFTLTGKIGASTVSGSTTATVRAGETTTLTFAMALADDEAVGVGTLTFTLNVPEGIGTVKASLVAFEEGADAVEGNIPLNGGKAVYSKDNLEAGAYLLTFELYSSAEASAKLASYSELCFVAGDLVSSGSATVSADELNSLYTITPVAGEGPAASAITGSQSALTVSRFSGVKQLASLSATGYIFNGWKLNGDYVTEINAAELTGNIEIVADWTELTKYAELDFSDTTPKAWNTIKAGSSNVAAKISVDRDTYAGYLGKGFWLVDGIYAEYRTSTTNALAVDNRVNGGTMDESVGNPAKAIVSEAITGPFTFTLVHGGSNSARSVNIFVSDSLETLFEGTPAATVKESDAVKTLSCEYLGTEARYVGVSVSSTDNTIWTPIKKITVYATAARAADVFHVTGVKFTNDGIETSALSIAKTEIGDGFTFTAEVPSYATVEEEKALTFSYDGGEGSLFTISADGVLTFKDGSTLADLTEDETGVVTVTTGNGKTAALNLTIRSSVLVSATDTVEITGKPDSAYTGDSYTLTANHDAYTEPVSYKWFDNDAEIAGATAAAYTYVPADTEAHAIKVEVAGANAKATGSVLITAAQSVRVEEGDTVAVTASAAAGSKVYKGQTVKFTAAPAKAYTEEIAYQWYNGEAAIEGATAAALNYVLTDADVAAAPSITVKVTSASNTTGIASEAVSYAVADAIVYSLKASDDSTERGSAFVNTYTVKDANSDRTMDFKVSAGKIGGTFTRSFQLGSLNASNCIEITLDTDAYVKTVSGHNSNARAVLPFSDATNKNTVAVDLLTGSAATNSGVTNTLVAKTWKLARGKYYIGCKDGTCYLTELEVIYEIIHANSVSIKKGDDEVGETLGADISDDIVLTAVTDPATGVTDPIVWSSDNESVAKVEVENGNAVVRMFDTGSAVITAACGAVSDSFTLNITGTRVLVSESDVITIEGAATAAKGASVTLTAKKNGEDVDYTEQVTYEWYKNSILAENKIEGADDSTYTFTADTATASTATTYFVVVKGSKEVHSEGHAVTVSMTDAQKVAAAKAELSAAITEAEIGWQGSAGNTLKAITDLSVYSTLAEKYDVTVSGSIGETSVTVTIKADEAGTVKDTIVINDPEASLQWYGTMSFASLSKSDGGTTISSNFKSAETLTATNDTGSQVFNIGASSSNMMSDGNGLKFQSNDTALTFETVLNTKMTVVLYVSNNARSMTISGPNGISLVYVGKTSVTACEGVTSTISGSTATIVIDNAPAGEWSIAANGAYTVYTTSIKLEKL